MPRLLLRTRPRSQALAFVAATALALSACGSNLDPSAVSAGRGGGAAGTVGMTSAAGAALSGSSSGQPLVDPGVSGAGSAGFDSAASGSSGTSTEAGTASSDGSAGSGDPGTTGSGAGTGGTTPDDNTATGDGPAGDCAGFSNTTGITDSTITLANVADISGPVPGLFESARQATQAFITYYNSSEELCGRKLDLLPLDSRGDAGADQQAYATACDKAFAAVGSVSAFDAGGSATAEACGLPDVRSATVTPERQGCASCFAAYTVSTSTIAASLPSYWLKAEPQASEHVGIFYVNVAAAKVNAEAFARAYERAGMTVDVLQPIDTGEFNYATYAQQMKDNDIEFVQYFGPYQFTIKLQQAMAQQSFVPKVFLQDPTIYDANYLKQAGDLADDAYVFTTNELFDDTSIGEMALYRSWLERVAPGAVPNYYGLYAWSAARLFVEEATALGGKLGRASLVSSLESVTKWTGNGLHSPMEVGRKTTSPCIKIIQYDGSAWGSVSGKNFTCGALINAG
ncbi:MAG: ABC transporter substrate-binding protein [Nocardioides sp.]